MLVKCRTAVVLAVFGKSYGSKYNAKTFDKYIYIIENSLIYLNRQFVGTFRICILLMISKLLIFKRYLDLIFDNLLHLFSFRMVGSFTDLLSLRDKIFGSRCCLNTKIVLEFSIDEFNTHFFFAFRTLDCVKRMSWPYQETD